MNEDMLKVLDAKAKTYRELSEEYEHWKHQFQLGTRGFQDAYNWARDNRERLEKQKWIQEKDVVAVVEPLVKQLDELRRLCKERPRGIPSLGVPKDEMQNMIVETQKWAEKVESVLNRRIVRFEKT